MCRPSLPPPAHGLHPLPLQALGTVQAARQVLQLAAASGFAAAFTLVVVQVLLMPLPTPAAMGGGPGGCAGAASLPLLLGMAAVAAGVLQLVLGRLERRFVFVDYVHADK